MKLKFSKMHGLGNDFVVLDGIRQNISLSPEQLRYLADRNFGVGCDQLLMVEKPAAHAGHRFLLPHFQRRRRRGRTMRQRRALFRALTCMIAGLTEKRRDPRRYACGGIIEPRLEDGRTRSRSNMGVPQLQAGARSRSRHAGAWRPSTI